MEPTHWLQSLSPSPVDEVVAPGEHGDVIAQFAQLMLISVHQVGTRSQLDDLILQSDDPKAQIIETVK